MNLRVQTNVNSYYKRQTSDFLFKLKFSGGCVHGSFLWCCSEISQGFQLLQLTLTTINWPIAPAQPPRTLVAVLGMRGPCTSFSFDPMTKSCFFSRICLARTRISCISSSSLSSSESYSPARSFSSSSFSRSSSFCEGRNKHVQKIAFTRWKHKLD